MDDRQFETKLIVVTWSLTIVGVVLAITVAPGAINMALGCGIVAMLTTALALFD